MAKISDDDPRPSYVQIADDLRSAIASGALKPGQRVESGRELASRYGVALMTAQKAVQLLGSEGVLITSQGRGIFVAEPQPQSTTRVGTVEQRLADLERRVQALESDRGE
ncbi:GntR family transcriptional regulator [Jiangella anatolica]|uniref:GntR family transcriptional regulator n=1 Tax=Jiangella anatolica TaxID=2670374 RepID=UPI001314369D|nr:GntR family transcriptional regulator [Jiangella anatolica]